jgi:hypothetical protein
MKLILYVDYAVSLVSKTTYQGRLGVLKCCQKRQFIDSLRAVRF